MSDPPWNLLPHSPQQFFGLSDGFDRKTLKRAYNVLIRQFKPERSPEEFQRIRAAFESLDQQLRYGESFSIPTQGISVYQWTAPTADNDASPSAPGDREQSQPPQNRDRNEERAENLPARTNQPPKSLAEQLEDLSAAELTQQLNRKSEKTPADYFALAILADTLPKRDPIAFLKWLLAGIKKFPDDSGLCALLVAYIRTEVTAKQAPGILKTIASLIPKDRFFFLTEGLWDVLMRSGDFQAFRATLAECESKLMDHRVEARVAFYLHILPAALWYGDKEWLDEAIDFVNQHADAGWRYSDDLERLDALREYMTQRAAMLRSGNEYLQQLDDVIRSYCTDTEGEFDRQFLEMAIVLGSHNKDVVENFVLPKGVNQHIVYSVWYRIDCEVANRHGVEDDAEEQDEKAMYLRLAKRFARFTKLDETALATNSVQMIWILRFPLFLAYLYMFFGPPLLTSSISNTTASVLFGYAVGFILLITMARYVVIPWWDWLKERVWTRIYLTHYRSEILEIISVLNVPVQVLSVVINNDEYTSQLFALTNVRRYIMNDFAMIIMTQCTKYRA